MDIIRLPIRNSGFRPNPNYYQIPSTGYIRLFQHLSGSHHFDFRDHTHSYDIGRIAAPPDEDIVVTNKIHGRDDLILRLHLNDVNQPDYITVGHHADNSGYSVMSRTSTILSANASLRGEGRNTPGGLRIGETGGQKLSRAYNPRFPSPARIIRFFGAAWTGQPFLVKSIVYGDTNPSQNNARFYTIDKANVIRYSTPEALCGKFYGINQIYTASGNRSTNILQMVVQYLRNATTETDNAIKNSTTNQVFLKYDSPIDTDTAIHYEGTSDLNILTKIPDRQVYRGGSIMNIKTSRGIYQRMGSVGTGLSDWQFIEPVTTTKRTTAMDGTTTSTTTTTVSTPTSPDAWWALIAVYSKGNLLDVSNFNLPGGQVISKADWPTSVFLKNNESLTIDLKTGSTLPTGKKVFVFKRVQ